MALTTEQFDMIKLHASIGRKSHPGHCKDQLMPVDLFGSGAVLKKPAPSEYRADQWHLVDGSLPRIVSEWACKPY
ncbi:MULTISPECIES: hypothetical protein [Vibrio harveyi group]|uniref:Uncharacterized protein n=1 Tax=Vibrio owensii CAIM 1854 = LMG 25443 TaxID=1229493 RepID=A0A0C1WAB1_9VIBR|nr:hypothetical protein [Vibrio owensii]KIF53247.1 hypothetical protein H735_09985 [Vibrio owensii CAIM 1854 = LMG 25443]